MKENVWNNFCIKLIIIVNCLNVLSFWLQKVCFVIVWKQLHNIQVNSPEHYRNSGKFLNHSKSVKDEWKYYQIVGAYKEICVEKDKVDFFDVIYKE